MCRTMNACAGHERRKGMMGRGKYRKGGSVENEAGLTKGEGGWTDSGKKKQRCIMMLFWENKMNFKKFQRIRQIKIIIQRNELFLHMREILCENYSISKA